ncbi:T9SS type A sorting domain-containing protein [Flavobacterium facile]|uniref:T9SS type A sorting domain-containing protein n=1 Tax=Flavobacterium facile TaxID=2893174 RepID=UPI002E7902A0|nr:T9SS type A sorting domain-containing protein [Flavobacterium sp. T-12]
MFKKSLGLVLILFTYSVFSQTQNIASISVGGGSYTLPPISAQSEFSKSQTIYYPDQLKFTGTINSIRYFKAFGTQSMANSNNWKVKIGLTNKQAFSNGDNFVDTSTFTEVFSGVLTLDTSYNINIIFNTPFYYDGLSNILIEVEETSPGLTSSGSTGFQGSEDFANPPKRTMVQMWGTSSATSTVYENSYPETEFFGNLQQCMAPGGNISNITENSATLNFSNNANITGYNYIIYPENTPEPINYTFTTQATTNLTNLLAAQKYYIKASTNCTNPPGLIYSVSNFTTLQQTISVPHTITFEGDFSRDYLLSSGYLANAIVQPNIGNNNSNGLKFMGSTGSTTPWDSNNVWVNNTEFISRISLKINLTNNPANPILTFDLKQKLDTSMRILVDGFVLPYTYNAVNVNDTDFRKITIDLSQFNGRTITFNIEHLSLYSGATDIRVGYIDNIELKSGVCYLTKNEINVTPTQNSLTLDYTDANSNFDFAIIPYNSSLADRQWTSISLPYTITNLTAAKAYKIYLRKKCNTEDSNFIELTPSINPETINTLPFVVYNQNSTLNSYISPNYRNSSSYVIFNSPTSIAMLQKHGSDLWVGGTSPTESQAWIDNSNFIFSNKMIVNATNFTSLILNINLKLARLGTNSSWFRVLVNGNQVGSSYTATTVNSDPFQLRSFDLSSYVGNILTIELQHSGKDTGFSSGGVNDAAYIKKIDFTGVLENETFEMDNLKIYPNPFTNYIKIEGLENEFDISLFSIDGKEIMKVSKLNSSQNIDLSKLETGIYNMKIKTTDSIINKTIIKK